MIQVCRLLVTCLILLAGAPSYAADGDIEGTYRLYAYNGVKADPAIVLKLAREGKKLVGSIVLGESSAKSIKQVSMDGKVLRIDFGGGSLEDFEGIVEEKGAILGSILSVQRLIAAKLEKTAEKTLGPSVPIKEFGKTAEMMIESTDLAIKMRDVKDREQRSDLIKKMREIRTKAVAGVPAACWEVLEKHPNSSGAFVAGSLLLQDPKKQLTEAEARKCVEIATAASAKHGPRLSSETAAKLIEGLLAKKELKGLALEQARKVNSLLTDQSSTEERVRALRVLIATLKSNGKTDEARDRETQFAKLDLIFDQEELTKLPPFKPTIFAGRKGKGDRKVVVELFTNSQYHYCVAANVAFLALEKSYKPTELILLQYQLEYPKPNPLANADAEARAKYYGDMRTPGNRFNGKWTVDFIGGSIYQSEAQYNAWREFIDPILEEGAETKLTLKASQTGNMIDIKANVAGLKKPGNSKRLRFVLAEETIKYAGANKPRFHHHVVRSFPGGVDGVALTKDNSQHNVSVNLDELRTQLNQYMAESAAKQPFPNADRPLDLKKLKVVAMVQDDESGEILQVMQVDVDGKAGAKVDNSK